MVAEEVFSRLKAHALEGMVFHDEMVRYYGFLNLDEWKYEHKHHYEDETRGYHELCDYYINHYNMLIPHTPMNRPDVIPDSWYRYARQDVDTGTRRNAIEVGARKWVEWERQTKQVYQEAWKELIDIGEVAAAHFIAKYVCAVDDELKCAKKKYMTLDI